MKRIEGDDVAEDLHGSGKDGFTDGNPGTEAATVVTAEWLNEVQEELLTFIEEAGLTPSTTKTQVRDAVRAIAWRFSNANGIATTAGEVRSRDLPTGGFRWCDANGAAISPTRTKYLSLSEAMPLSTNRPLMIVTDNAVDSPDPDQARTTIGSAGTTDGWCWHVPIPRDAVVTEVVAGVNEAGSPTGFDTMTLRVYSSTENLSNPGTQTVQRIGLASATLLAGDKVLTATLSPTFTKNSLNNLYVRINCSNSGSVNSVFWVYVAFSDPGPRNH